LFDFSDFLESTARQLENSWMKFEIPDPYVT